MGWIKINVDATIFVDDKVARVGIVARGNHSEFLWVATMPIIHTKAFIVEALALKSGYDHCYTIRAYTCGI